MLPAFGGFLFAQNSNRIASLEIFFGSVEQLFRFMFPLVNVNHLST